MYAELHARSAFSFLAGASTPEDLIEACAERGVAALAMLDRDNISGAVRFHKAATEKGIKAHVGAEVTLVGGAGTVLPLIAETRDGYRNLCRLISEMKLRAEKGKAAATFEDLAQFSRGLVCLTDNCPLLEDLLKVFGPHHLYVEIQRHFDRQEEERNQELIAKAAKLKLPILATNGVTYARPRNRELYDVMTCIRHKLKISDAGRLLSRNAERFVKNESELETLFADLPEALANTRELSARLSYTMDDLGYEFPTYPVPAGETLNSYLRQLAHAGAICRYGYLNGRVSSQIEHELGIIEKLGLAGYFLVVWEMVEFCRESGFLVQGRGSAANSAVCYSLGITAIDPIAMELLFERFLSEERGEWPDIDLDLPSGDHREQVIQHVYDRYGRRGAAMTANHITYRSRSAIREIGKVLGFDEHSIDQLSKLIPQFEGEWQDDSIEKRFTESGLSLNDPRTAKLFELYVAIQNLPRHLGQHSGGMVICQGALDSIVPIEPATMPGRTVVQWDKEDIADMGIVKVDLLGLGMMAVIKDTIELVREHYGDEVDLAHLPSDDADVYGALQLGDTVGWFQVESRAQMSCLPRTRPAHFYDLVVQVAIIRPGPIVGQMASPYIRRRQGKESPEPLHPSLAPVLERTLGVPLFQEQLMRMAMTVSDFSAGEAEELRRAFGSKRSKAAMAKVEERLRSGMAAKGIEGEVQERIVRSITSFAMYGFPESHAASFALLAYASGYFKVHYLAAFTAAMLNNQPLGFYGPETLVKDAQRHGLRFLPVDIRISGWESSLERDEEVSRGDPCVRLGLNYVKALRQTTADAIVAERGKRPFGTMQDLVSRVPAINRRELRNLSALGAFNHLGNNLNLTGHHRVTRRDALWDAELMSRPLEPLFSGEGEKSLQSPLEPMTEIERVMTDIRLTGMSIGKHPIRFLRVMLDHRGVVPVADLWKEKDGGLVEIAGLIICRQRPQTASGIVFLSVEDETGIVNVVVMSDLFERERAKIVNSPAAYITGILQNLESTVSVRALRIEPLEMIRPKIKSHDFH